MPQRFHMKLQRHFKFITGVKTGIYFFDNLLADLFLKGYLGGNKR